MRIRFGQLNWQKSYNLPMRTSWQTTKRPLTPIFMGKFEVKWLSWGLMDYQIKNRNLQRRNAALKIDCINEGLMQRGFDSISPKGTTPNILYHLRNYTSFMPKHFELSQEAFVLQPGALYLHRFQSVGIHTTQKFLTVQTFLQQYTSITCNFHHLSILHTGEASHLCFLSLTVDFIAPTSISRQVCRRITFTYFF